MTRRVALFAALAAVTALGLTACGGTADETTTLATTEPSPTTTASPPPTEMAPPLPPETKAVTITYRNGKVEGGIQRERYEKGETIVLLATSDVPEELHVHGYDKSVALAPGKRARIAFPATLLGVFEAELEERGLLVAELTVSP